MLTLCLSVPYQTLQPEPESGPFNVTRYQIARPQWPRRDRVSHLRQQRFRVCGTVHSGQRDVLAGM